jgi:tetratricopeptide (TPR) repeat protein
MSTPSPVASQHWSDPALIEEQLPHPDSGIPDEAPVEAPPEDKAEVLEWAYEEYWRRVGNGEEIDREAWCERFPNYRTSLRRLLCIDKVIEDHSSLLRKARFHWPEAGEERGDLKLIRLLGRGSFARVYLAQETTTGGRPVVVKLSPEGPHEAHTLGLLDHPGIVPVLSARPDEASGLAELRMPFLGTATLLDVLDRAYPRADSPLPKQASVILDTARSTLRPNDPAPVSSQPPAALLKHGTWIDGVLHLGVQIADALAFLHARGIGHRDLKPSNVLLSPSGAPLLLDFNLSTELHRTTPCLGGTLPYMAPEQVCSCQALFGGAVDDRADLWSLAVILYELLTGVHPFGGLKGMANDEAADLLLQRQREGFLPLRQRNPYVPQEVARLIERCLAWDPAQRPQSAVELAAGLRRHFAAGPRLRRWAGRHRVLVASLAVLFLSAGAAAGAFLGMRDSLPVREHKAGLAAFQEGRYPEAQQHFERARSAAPDQPAYWRAEARAHAAQQDQPSLLAANKVFLAAEKQFARAPDAVQAEIKADYCWFLSRWGDPGGARIRGQEAVKLGDHSAALLNNLAYARVQATSEAKEIQAALEELNQAIAEDPSLWPAFWNRGMARYMRYKNLPSRERPPALSLEAQDDILTALANLPPNLELHFDAACIIAVSDLPRQARIEQVLPHLSEAVRLGQSPQSIERNRDLRELCKDHLEYAALKNAKAGPVVAISLGRLVTPPFPAMP